jgi:hypothetical protein
LRRYIAAISFPLLVVAEKIAHGFQAEAAKFIRGCNEIPNEFLLIATRLPNYFCIRGINALLDLFGGKLIEGVAGNDSMPLSTHLHIKIRWPVGASENASL